MKNKKRKSSQKKVYTENNSVIKNPYFYEIAVGSTVLSNVKDSGSGQDEKNRRSFIKKLFKSSAIIGTGTFFAINSLTSCDSDEECSCEGVCDCHYVGNCKCDDVCNCDEVCTCEAVR